MGIDRYVLRVVEEKDLYDGEWVKHDEHEEVVEELESTVERLEADIDRLKSEIADLEEREVELGNEIDALKALLAEQTS